MHYDKKNTENRNCWVGWLQKDIKNIWQEIQGDRVSGAAARTGDFIKGKKENYYKNRNGRIGIK